jgi:hypothetical protein
VRVAVTGAFGFSGRYIAQRLLALRHEVITLTNSPDRSNPSGGSIKAFSYNFSKPHDLEKSLRGIDVLMNTYWVRFDNPPHFKQFERGWEDFKGVREAGRVYRICCDFVGAFSPRTALSPTKAPSILRDLSTIEGKADSQSRNHEYLGRDRLRGWEQTNQ